MARSERSQRKVGYAVVGLGHIVQSAILPAFQHAKANSTLAALVSGDEEKREALGRHYQVPTYSYDQLEECIDHPEVQAVYIGLPNDQHCDFTVRAAQAGAHVFCEKPLALSSAQCEQMISACREHSVKLMTGYRLHLEPASLKALEKVLDGDIGQARYFSSSFSYQVVPGNIRVQAERGGGPLWDIGIYCLNAARTLFQSEPEEVFAFATRSSDPRFQETMESVVACLRFSGDRLAQFTCSFGAAHRSSFDLVGTDGSLSLDEAFQYQATRHLFFRRGEESKSWTFKKTDQFGPEISYFSECILEDREPEMSGREGLADVRVIEALHASISDGRPISLSPFEKGERPRPEMERDYPYPHPPRLVEVSAPAQD